jgi:hypothetical protein
MFKRLHALEMTLVVTFCVCGDWSGPPQEMTDLEPTFGFYERRSCIMFLDSVNTACEL